MVDRMEVKKYKYTDWATAPMTFYSILRVLLIFGVFINFFRLIFPGNYSHNWYGYLYYLLIITLEVVAIAGLFMRSWSGPCAYLAVLLLGVADKALALILMGAYNMSDSSAVGWIAELILVPIYMILVWIYFKKRRLLFTPRPKDYVPQVSGSDGVQVPAASDTETIPVTSEEVPAQNTLEPVKYDEPVTTQVAAPPADIPGAIQAQVPPEPDVREKLPVRFCRKCGGRLLPDSRFCSYCGVAVFVEKEDSHVLS